MKRIVPEFTLSEEQLNTVRTLARECNLCEETVRILYGRGIRDKDAVNKFMSPSKSHFISPFYMSGMRQAVDLITRARDEGWVVLVYGDYDADGICASTIMRGALRDFGIEPFVVVPERKDGYGLSNELIDRVFDEYFPQLVITVDCGISCAEQVEYIKELGAEVIVTDHHELPDKIPDCICINPKFDDDYIYDNLCGAGVAFKVGCALNGDSGYKYLDYAAIATVADSVPLTGENRDIVYEGLKLINERPAKNYAQFLSKQDTVTSQTLAFTLAPKINAAGRMNDAKAALELFAERDENKIIELSNRLSEYNVARQKCCDELYADAKRMIREKGSCGRIILLCNENWNSGFVGIVAARIVDEFSRPAILFVKRGDTLKGSARSIDGVNVFEALKACSQYISEFGGHSQAAGVNVTEDNFENLERALDEYMRSNYSEEDFAPVIFINGTLDGAYNQKFVKELELLEPFGVGNRRPLFAVEETALPTKRIKTTHLSLKSDKLELMYFGGLKHKKLLESEISKRLVFEYNVSVFRGKETVKGFVRDVVYDKRAFISASEELALSYLETLSCESSGNIPVLSISKAADFAASEEEGTVFIAWDENGLNLVSGVKNLDCNIFVPSLRSFSKTVLFAPSADADLNGFKRAIILNETFGMRLENLNGVEVYKVQGAEYPSFLNELSCERDELLSIFAHFANNTGAFEGGTVYEVVKNHSFANPLQTAFALSVFVQLGLIAFDSGSLRVNKGVKSKLENSELYNIVKGVKNG